MVIGLYAAALEEADLGHDNMQGVPSNHPLNDIGPIQAIHAVGSEGPGLLLFDGDLGVLRALIDAELISYLSLAHGHLKVADLIDVTRDLVHQLAQVLPFHLPTLVMKIKPDVSDLGVIQLLDELREFIAEC